MTSLDIEEVEDLKEEKGLKVLCQNNITVVIPRKYINEFKLLRVALEADAHATEIECTSVPATAVDYMVAFLDAFPADFAKLDQPLRGKLQNLLPLPYSWLHTLWQVDPETHTTFLDTYKATHFFDFPRLYMCMSAFIADVCRFHRTVDDINRALGQTQIPEAKRKNGRSQPRKAK